MRKHFPELKIRVINVVDLMKLQPASEHPHGLTRRRFRPLFTTDKPIIFAFHGYPWLIHRLTYRRTNHHNLHVRGYKEEGTTTTPFDMVVLNDLDRFHLVERRHRSRAAAGARRRAYVKQALRDKLIEHKHISRSTATTCRRSGTGNGNKRRGTRKHEFAPPLTKGRRRSLFWLAVRRSNFPPPPPFVRERSVSPFHHVRRVRSFDHLFGARRIDLAATGGQAVR